MMQPSPDVTTTVDAILARHDGKRGALIAMLLEVQEAFSYLPADAIVRLANALSIPTIQAYQVARFYKAFTFEPVGDRVVSVCTGTACYARGSESVMAAVRGAGGGIVVQTANCPGTCPAGPVMTVDGTCHTRVRPGD